MNDARVTVEVTAVSGEGKLATITPYAYHPPEHAVLRSGTYTVGLVETPTQFHAGDALGKSVERWLKMNKTVLGQPAVETAN